MNIEEFKIKLTALGACREAVIFCEGKSLQEAWKQCERGDWMLWLYAKLYSNNLKELTLAKGHCANTVRHLMTDERSIKAVDAAIAFGEGRITSKELNAAAEAAGAAEATGAAEAARAAGAAEAARAAGAAEAARAARAALAAAEAAAEATARAAWAAAEEAAWTAAGAAAEEAAWTAAGAAAEEARTKNQKETADICRKYLPIEIWNT